jgi:hypothetical protein
MAKAKSKKQTKEEPKAAEQQNPKLLDPKAIHELLGIYGSYEPPPPPIPTKGYTVFWDPGCSIQTLAKKKRELFYMPDLLTERFAKDTDQWKWRMIRLTPIEPNLTFADQEKKLKTGDKPATARELVTFLVLHFLTTGEKLEMCRWRCADKVDSGRRVIVGPFGDFGLEIANVSDLWKSPGTCLSVMCTPTAPRKK